MVEDKFHMITSQNCGDNHYVVEIPDDISLFEFFEMNLEFENGKMKSFKTEELDGESYSCTNKTILKIFQGSANCEWSELSNKYLTGWHQPDTFRYPNLDEAKKFCSMFPERYCRGITDEANLGTIFSIRIGDQFMDSPTGETSYIRSNCEKEIEHTKARNLMNVSLLKKY